MIGALVFAGIGLAFMIFALLVTHEPRAVRCPRCNADGIEEEKFAYAEGRILTGFRCSGADTHRWSEWV